MQYVSRCLCRKSLCERKTIAEALKKVNWLLYNIERTPLKCDDCNELLEIYGEENENS